MDNIYLSGFFLPRQVVNTKSFLQWSLVCLIFLFLIGLTGCADIRKLTMTKAQLSFFSVKDKTPCLRGYDVCIGVSRE
jgi:hypothetical protein